MASTPRMTPLLEFRPLAPSRWRDLERLFGMRGACGSWCMRWRLKRAELEKKDEGNRRFLWKIVESDEAPALQAYSHGQPGPCCAIAPGESYAVLEPSRTLKRVDDQVVRSVVCVLVARPSRRKGVTFRLLKAAVEFGRRKGAQIIEGYPVEPKKGRMPDAFARTGLAPAFRKAEFSEVLRRSESRRIVRLALRGR